MILKVKLDRKNPATWKFFQLRGAVTVSEECILECWVPSDDQEEPAAAVPMDNFIEAFNAFLLREDIKEGRDLFPVVRDEEKAIMFNLEAYLLNDEGKTIEKISAR